MLFHQLPRPLCPPSIFTWSASQSSFGTFNHAIEEGLLAGDIYGVGDTPSIRPLLDGEMLGAFFRQMHQDAFGETACEDDEPSTLDHHKGALWKHAEKMPLLHGSNSLKLSAQSAPLGPSFGAAAVARIMFSCVWLVIFSLAWKLRLPTSSCRRATPHMQSKHIHPMNWPRCWNGSKS